MTLNETEGLILKSYSLAEADKIVILLTKSEGLVRGVAKGAKRLKSRFGGSLEPFSIVHITYYQKEERELVSITGIELIKSFFGVASNPYFLQHFAYLTELIINFAPPHDPNEKLYRMAKICLETAVYNSKRLEVIALYFELWILKLGGFLPNWNWCENCRASPKTGEITNLLVNFQLICSKCQKSNSKRQISEGQRNIFNIAQRLNPADFILFAANQNEDVKIVSLILKRIITNILGKEMPGEKFLLAKT